MTYKNIKFEFVNPGFNAKDKDGNVVSEPNKVWVDVGNIYDSKNGFFDHHNLSKEDADKFQCAAQMLEDCLKDGSDYLQNVDFNRDEVTVVTHAFSDLDAIVSSYLMKEKLSNSEYYGTYSNENKDRFSAIEDLVKYTSLADTGRLSITPDSIRSLYAITRAISETKSISEIKDFGTMNQKVLERGHQLIDYVLNRREKFGITIDNPQMFPEGCPFEEEVAVINDDYSRYKEFMNNPENITIVDQIELPTIDDASKMKKVRGLIVHKEPRDIILFDGWARSQGFVFTSIPKYIDKDSYVDNPEFLRRKQQLGERGIEQLREEGIPEKVQLVDKEGNTVKTNRIVISVNPKAEVSLHFLGRALEVLERRKESQIVREDLTREYLVEQGLVSKRFKESYCKNNDPWYDGRGHNYTIIDTSIRGSVLTVKEIEEYMLNYFHRLSKAFTERIEHTDEAAFEIGHLGEKILEDRKDLKIDREYNVISK